MRRIVLIAHNLRSSHNVGSLIRTAEGLGVSKIYLTGYTPYPIAAEDDRLPHLAKRQHSQIAKTALGAETLIPIERIEDIFKVLLPLKRKGYVIVCLEQHSRSIYLEDYLVPDKLALIVGREVEGVEEEVLDAADEIIEIRMRGKKESFNVAQAAAMALYHLTTAK